MLPHVRLRARQLFPCVVGKLDVNRDVAVHHHPTGIGPERVKFAVLRLRRKLGWSDPDESPIESVRGFGYRYRRPGGES